MVRRLGITSLVFLLQIAVTLTYPDGPPLSACRDMQPRTQMGELGLEGHTEVAQSEEPTYGRPIVPPYHIHLLPATTSYEPSGVYNVYISSDQTNGGNAFTGILMQARRVTCYGNGTMGVENDAIGRFTLPVNTLLQTLDCNGDADSAVGHKSRQWKINETVQWHAPDQYVGHLAFWATIVQLDTVYWMGAHSVVLLDPNQPAPVTCGASILCHVNLSTMSLVTMLSVVVLFKDRFV